MTKTLKLAFAAVMTVALVAPAMAQSNFPDVPDNHWAYEALGKMMKEGILVGYPDGLFRGPRPASRYEMAVAINAAYQKLAGMDKGLTEKIDELQKAIDNAPKPQTVDLTDIKAQLEELKAGLAGMKGYGDDIASLKKMAQTFEKELASLGVDVEGMKKELDELKKKVDGMPKPAVAFSGDVNLLVLAGNSKDGTPGITTNGILTGLGRGSYAGQPVGMTRDLSVLHEMGLTLQGTNTEGPKWNATLVVGNTLPAFGNQNQGALGHGDATFSDSASTDIYFQTFGVTFDTSLLGQGFSAEIGRLPYQVGNYLLKRPDYTDLYKNDRWDNGNYYVDGGLFKFNFGKVGVEVIAARTSDRKTSTGIDTNPMPLGDRWTNPEIIGVTGAGTGVNTVYVDQMLGVTANIPLSDIGNVKLAYLWQDANTLFTTPITSDPLNRMNTYGGELNLKFGNVKLNVNYAKTQYTDNTSNVVNDNNDAYDIKLGYDLEKWGVGAGYREIKANFGANGDWGRIGTSWNPTNIKSFYGNAWFTPTENLKIWGKGEFAKPKDDSLWIYGPLGDIAGASALDKVDSYKLGLDYKLNTNWNVGLTYEDVKWTYFAGPEVKERWYNVNLAYAMGPNASLSLGYMLSDNDYTRNRMGEFKGGLFSTQVSVKF